MGSSLPFYFQASNNSEISFAVSVPGIESVSSHNRVMSTNALDGEDAQSMPEEIQLRAVLFKSSKLAVFWVNNGVNLCPSQQLWELNSLGVLSLER